MTQQEADELVAKLRLIWVPEGVKRTKYGLIEHRFDFECEIEPEVTLSVTICFNPRFEKSIIVELEGPNYNLQCFPTKVWISPEKGYCRDKVLPFAVQWIPLLRRGCFLSGFALECTEHEKLEWTL